MKEVNPLVVYAGINKFFNRFTDGCIEINRLKECHNELYKKIIGLKDVRNNLIPLGGYIAVDEQGDRTQIVFSPDGNRLSLITEKSNGSKESVVLSRYGKNTITGNTHLNITKTRQDFVNGRLDASTVVSEDFMRRRDRRIAHMSHEETRWQTSANADNKIYGAFRGEYHMQDGGSDIAHEVKTTHNGTDMFYVDGKAIDSMNFINLAGFDRLNNHGIEMGVPYIQRDLSMFDHPPVEIPNIVMKLPKQSCDPVQ